MTKDEKEQLTPEMIRGYHDMAKKSMSQSQEIIDELRGGIDKEDISLVKGIQTGLDHATHILWKLKEGGATINPTVLSEFDTLNQNIEAFNKANHQTLVHPRKIGDITKMEGNKTNETDNNFPSNNKVNFSEAENRKYNSAINELRRIKKALSSATSPEAARRLISEFLQASIGIPQDIIPTDLAYDNIESMYTDKISQITNSIISKELIDKEKESGEKIAERVTGSIKIVTEEINHFLNREDIKANSAKNKRWAQNPSMMTAKDAISFTESHDKEKDEEHMLVGLVLRDPVKKVLERIDVARSELMSVHKHENHPEVVSYDNKVIKELQTYTETSAKLGERFKDKSKVLKNIEVIKVLGEEKTTAESQSYADKAKDIEQYTKTLSDDLAKRRARRLGNAMIPEPSPNGPLSPTPTPKTSLPPKGPSKG